MKVRTNLVEYWQSLCLNYLDVLTNKVSISNSGVRTLRNFMYFRAIAYFTLQKTCQ